MKLKEIEQKIAELTALKEKAEREEQEELHRKRHEEAVALYPELINILRRLDDLGYLPARLFEALKDQTGKFNPGQYIKRPRPINRPVDEPELVKQRG